MNEEKKIVEKAIAELEAKLDTTDSVEELRFTPKDILLKRDIDFWKDKDKEHRLKMIDVYNKQVNDLIKILPTFKIANATIHFDETSPHMHIVGVPIIENCTRGMKKQVGKSQLFTKESLTKIQDKMRTACIKSFNKFYGMDIKLKEKQKGRNQDINVKDMSNYTNIKKQLAEKKKKLDAMLKEVDEEYRTTIINFAKYKLVMFAMAKLMEMESTEQNKVALYLFNNISTKNNFI